DLGAAVAARPSASAPTAKISLFITQPLLLRFCLAAERAGSFLWGFPGEHYGPRHATAKFLYDETFWQQTSQDFTRLMMAQALVDCAGGVLKLRRRLAERSMRGWGSERAKETLLGGHAGAHSRQTALRER